MAGNNHFDKDKEERKGWWQKKEDGQPIPSYRDACKSSGNGFLGPWYQAHHVLPAISIRAAADESNKDMDYLEDVKYITDWNINNKDNMIGLPSLFSYQLFYGQSANIAPPIDRYSRWFGWFNNRFSETVRKSWLDGVIATPPENNPIHQPVSWGHSIYNKIVQSDIKKEVWDMIDEQRKEHKLDAENVQVVLELLQEDWLGYLKSRGATSKEQWDKVTTSKDLANLGPYTMYDVSKHPLLG